MLTYNTKLKKLILPEYGRNIQKMVDHCLGIEDREERTACAFAIVETLEQMFPADGNVEEYRRKLWDHLAIMSDFKLDIDWPFEVIQQESLQTQPQPILLPNPYVEYKQYGQIIINMIDKASQLPEGPERDELAVLIANHMKKLLLAMNPDGVDDERVFADLAQISEGHLRLDPAQVKLYDYKSLPAPKKKKKK